MKFYEDRHEYIENDVKFTPVTYFLKTFEPWKDWDAIAEKKAKKLGVTKESLLKQWNDNKIEAANKGTAFHKKMENLYTSPDSQGTVIVANDEEGVACPILFAPTTDGVKEDTEMYLKDNTVYPEKIIWSRKYKLCGTADLVEVVNGKINVKDYKTNKKLDFESFKHPVLGSAKLRYPVSSLDDCNFNIYQLQLNAYMYMLLQANRNLKMGKMEILHVQFDEKGEYSHMVVHPVKNLQKEVKLMLEAFKLKKNL